jgi:hypothetical protein
MKKEPKVIVISLNQGDNRIQTESIEEKKKATLEFFQGLSIVIAILGFSLAIIPNTWANVVGIVLVISSSLVIAWSRYEYEPTNFYECMLILGAYFTVLGGVLNVDYWLSIPYTWLGASSMSLVIIGFLFMGTSYLKKVQ